MADSTAPSSPSPQRAGRTDPAAPAIPGATPPPAQSVPPSAWAWLGLGLLAASQSGNIIRLGDASPLAITAWRLTLSCLLLAPFGLRRWRAVAALGGPDRFLLGLAGVALTLHWLTWIAAVQKSTVANAAVFFSVNPVLLSLVGVFLFGERAGGRLIASVALGLGGVVVMGLGDLRWAPDVLEGDLYAIACAVLFAVYFGAGKRLRARLDGLTYVTFVYGTAGLVAFPLLLVSGHPVFHYGPKTWLCFVGMALVPTLLGHTGLNVALRHLDVSRVSVSTLSEPILAGAVAAWAWGERITAQTAVGYALIAGSVVVLALDLRRSQRPAPRARP